MMIWSESKLRLQRGVNLTPASRHPKRQRGRLPVKLAPKPNNSEQGVDLDAYPAASSIRHDSFNLNLQSKPRTRSGVLCPLTLGLEKHHELQPRIHSQRNSF